jgi:hypothetical protein
MRRLILLVSLCTIVLAPGLLRAKDVPLNNDSTVPGATGKVAVGKDKNGNVKFTVEVRHLAQPASLTPAKEVYVVWVQARDGQPENVGKLEVNKNLEGKLEAPTSHQQFDVFITGEDAQNVQTPSGPQLLHGTVGADTGVHHRFPF